MQPYWRHVKELLEPLTYLVKDGDPDGAELYFTVSTNRKQSKKSSDLVALVGRHQPIGNTDIRHRLGTILQKYCASLRDQVVPAGSWQSRPVARAATIYVLTDGKWAGGTNACDIIEDTLNVLKSLKCDRKQLGIQFISFGQDVDGLKRLEDLDDFGKLAHVELYVHVRYSLQMMRLTLLGISSTPRTLKAMSGRCYLARSIRLSTKKILIQRKKRNVQSRKSPTKHWCAWTFGALEMSDESKAFIPPSP